ncbi:unnamed protein product [Anisakis simplex]|uniref:Protein quaking (inferred by orthology to a human protein) n=1 Tax=Anisakis simplex TaxID=6269 RepID=A0A0M3JUS3_ANISI|nr:unnamed protein product [Anisakis simplex]
MTAKQLEQETGCKIMVRGKGSMRDKAKEEANRGKPNWEHLSEDLHVLIQCEDTPNRAVIKLKRASAEVKKLLVPSSEDDELKKKQLMELAIINGTYRSGTVVSQAQAAQAAAAVATKSSLAALQARLMAPMPLAQSAASLRSPTLAGAPIILSPSRNATNSSQNAAAAFAAQLQAVANQQQQNAAAAAAFSQQAAAAANPAAVAAAAAAGIPAHLLHPQSIAQNEYGQFYINSMSYDPTTQTTAYAVPVSSASAAASLQAAQQQQYAAAAAAMLGASPYLSDYSAAAAVDLSHAGAMLCNQRRVLGQSREHPYAAGKSSSS